jgi:hypothetical protein
VKKILSLILALCLVTVLVPVTGSAEKTGTEEAPKVYVDADTGSDEAPEDGVYQTLAAAAQALEGPDGVIRGTIQLQSDVELTAPLLLETGDDLTVDGGRYAINFHGSSPNSAFNGRDDQGTEGFPSQVTLTVRNTTFRGAGDSAGYAAVVGFNSFHTQVTFEGCVFENLYCGVYVNPVTRQPGEWESGPEITLVNNTFSNTNYGYSVDEVTLGSVPGCVQVTFEENGEVTPRETFPWVTISREGAVVKTEPTLAAALASAQDGDTLHLMQDFPIDGTGKVNNQGALTITKDVTISGNGYTLKGEHFQSDPEGSDRVASMINVEEGAQVSLENLTIDSNGAKHGVNIFSPPSVTRRGRTSVTVENVTVKNGKGYGVVVNNSVFQAKGLVTEENGWGGLNVDQGGDATLHTAQLKEDASVVYENPQTEEETTQGSLTILGGTYEKVILQAQKAEDTVGGTVQVKGGSFDGITVKGDGAANVEPSKTVSVTGGTFQETVGGSDTGDQGIYVPIEELIPEDAEVELTPEGSVETKPTPMPSPTATPTPTPAPSASPSPTPSPEPEEDPVVPIPFADVAEESWYYSAVEYVYANAIMAGTGETTFDPHLKLTRAMAVQILYNLEDQPEVDGTAEFTDLEEDGYYVQAVTWAASQGVVAGMGDGRFAPDRDVTREEFAQMMYNYAVYQNQDVTKTGDLTQFPDAGDISDWAETALSWANGSGLINGHEDSKRVDPRGTAIRAQAASILMNFHKGLDTEMPVMY